MEEKPEGTPNPLNPNTESAMLDANPSEPMGATDSTTIDEILGEAATPVETAAPTEKATPIEITTEKVNPVETAAPAALTVNVPPRPANPARPVDPMIPVRPATEMPQPEMSRPVVETPQPTPEVPQPITETFQPAAEAQPMGVVTNMDGTVPAQNIDPMSRPMQKAVEQLPPKPKKKKTGLIIGMIISLFVAIGCGVAAALIFANSNKTDPVMAAVDKLMSGGAPTNASFDGTIDLDITDASSPFTDVKIILRGDAVLKSMINSSQATLNANLKNGGSFSVDISEVYAANGDLYLKIEGITNALDSQHALSSTLTSGDDEYYEEVDCLVEDGCSTGAETAESLAATLEILEVIDGEWVRIPTSSVGTVVPSLTTTESDLTCWVNLAKDAGGNSNSISSIYGKNPFITSTSENLSVVSEKNPIYRVLINGEKLTGFLNEAQNLSVMDNFASCLGYENGITSENAIEKSLQSLPEVYVEIDEEHNFTRLYIKSTSRGDSTKVTVDLNFTFPANVNVPEPVEYTEIETLLQEIVIKMYETQGGVAEGEVIEVQDIEAE